jgi:hypothetical protein
MDVLVYNKDHPGYIFTLLKNFTYQTAQNRCYLFGGNSQKWIKAYKSLIN